MADTIAIAVDADCPKCRFPEIGARMNLTSDGSVDFAGPFTQYCRKCGWKRDVPAEAKR